MSTVEIIYTPNHDEQYVLRKGTAGCRGCAFEHRFIDCVVAPDCGGDDDIFVPFPTSSDAEDAARYRWLREGDNDERVMLVYDHHVHGSRPYNPAVDDAYLPRGVDLDAIIDEEMKKDQQ
jgi:hypothetical protein